MSSSVLAGKVALVTGAGSGIGAAAACRFAREGARVALLSRGSEDLRAVAAEITEAGGEALALTADVADVTEMEAAFRQLTARWKRLDVVFANAGVNGAWAGLDDLTIEEWDETVRINLRGTFLTLKFALPLLRDHGGSVIVTSSVNGTRMFSNTGATAYAATKAGQVAMAKMLAVELAAHGIRVNVICPGAIATEIGDNTDHRAKALGPPVNFPKGAIPLTGKTPGRADQVADLAVFLASDASAHVSGTEIFIDGAQSLLQG